MPAPKTTFIPYSCFGYYDQNFIQCSKKCKHSQSCLNATKSSECENIRKQFKFTNKHINDLVQQWKIT